MIICERCSTENLDGARYCDECGAALWLAGRASGLSPNGERSRQNDGRKINSLAETSARPGATKVSERLPVSAKKSSAMASGGKAHAKLVIERGRSAGKQFVLSNDDSQIGLRVGERLENAGQLTGMLRYLSPPKNDLFDPDCHGSSSFSRPGSIDPARVTRQAFKASRLACPPRSNP